MMCLGKERGTYMVDTIMVGITRSGMISKRTRTNNQAVGLHKRRGHQMYRRARTNEHKAVETRTYNTRLSVHAQIVGVSPAHYGARSETRALSTNPDQIHHQNESTVRSERRGSETHEEEKNSDTGLESCNAVARLEVQPTDEHAE